MKHLLMLFFVFNSTVVAYSQSTIFHYQENGNIATKKLNNRVVDSTQLSGRVNLEGAYELDQNLLSDNLRASSLLPISGGGENIQDSTNFISYIIQNPTIVYTDYGPASITDWVRLELRDKRNPVHIQYSRSALIRRDGLIVDVDGVSPVIFDKGCADSYYLAIQHRNHLGIMTEEPIELESDQVTSLNFTNGLTPTFGLNAQTEVDGLLMMIAGDANGDGQINAVDRNLYWRPQNGQPFDYSISTADFNLDGSINAIDLNVYWRINNSKVEQLPEN